MAEASAHFGLLRTLTYRHLGAVHATARGLRFESMPALARHGHARDKKRGCEQIEYGMLAPRAGLPLAVRVFQDNTAGLTAFARIAGGIHDPLGARDMVLVGNRGMFTSARIADLKKDAGSSTGGIPPAWRARTMRARLLPYAPSTGSRPRDSGFVTCDTFICNSEH